MDPRLRALVLVAVVFVGCGRAAGPSSTATATVEARSAPPTATAASQILLPGRIVRANVAPDMYSTFADSGRLFAIAQRDGPAPYLASIQQYDPASAGWQKVFEDDARFTFMK